MKNDVRISSSHAARAERRRLPGVKYRLRVIPGSEGLLELVEEPPRRTWFQEWARAMQHTSWAL